MPYDAINQLYIALGLRVGVHEQRGANRGMCGGKAASSGEVRSVRGAIFFWLLFFWASKRKVTYEILACD